MAGKSHNTPFETPESVPKFDPLRDCRSRLADRSPLRMLAPPRSSAEAVSAEDALRLVRDGLKPDIIVTDHLMPGMSGTELARELKATVPEVLVLLISGYAETAGVDPTLPRLIKPFRNADLAASLSALTLSGPMNS